MQNVAVCYAVRITTAQKYLSEIFRTLPDSSPRCGVNEMKTIDFNRVADALTNYMKRKKLSSFVEIQ